MARVRYVGIKTHESRIIRLLEVLLHGGTISVVVLQLWNSNVGACNKQVSNALKMISTSVPVGRLGIPNEIAKTVVFLASDDSSYTTATELFVDGDFEQV